MLYPVIGLPPFELGGDQDSCTPLPLAGAAVRFRGAEGTVMPVCVLVGVGVGVLVGVNVGVCVAVGVLVGVNIGVFVGVLVGVKVGVCVAVGVLVGVGVGPPPQEANLKLPMRVRQLNCVTPVG